MAPAPVERRVVWLTQDALVVGRLAAGDALNILMSSGSPAPVRLELTRGENSAVLTFAAAR